MYYAPSPQVCDRSLLRTCCLLMLVFFTFTISITKAQTELPATWRDDYFPQFYLTIKPDDLTALLAEGSTAKVPMTLSYQGQIYLGTIRQRLGNTSLCENKRQFRLDFAGKVKFPDGYISDRFETDRGSCYTLHEWLAWDVIDQAGKLRPDLKVLRKKSNVVAIYFNGELYHVQTLLEDVNKDLLAPQIGTRKITLYESGCYANTEGTELANFCSIFAPEQMQTYLHIPSFLYSTGVVQMLGGADNYPRYPYNHYFVQETESKKVWFMVDDLDSTIDSYSDGQSDPFETYITEGNSQRHFTALVSDPVYRSQYSAALRELLPLFHPDKLQPLVAAKYAQVRATLFASPQLPLGADWYDYVYLSELPAWIEARYAYLTKLLAQDHETTNGIPTAVIAPLVPTLEATDMEGVQVTLNGANSTDPDNDPLTFLWLVDGQEMGQSAIIESKLGIGSHLIRLTVNDGRGGSGTTTANIEITPPPPPQATEVTIKAVSPAFIRRGAGVVLEITGTGFSPYSEVSFSDSNVRVQLYDLRGKDIILVYLIADNSGTYDLKVINPDGKTALLSDALTVGD